MSRYVLHGHDIFLQVFLFYLLCVFGNTWHSGWTHLPGLEAVGDEELWTSSQKERETLSGKYVQTGDMLGEGCLILCPSCNVCVIGDGQMLANNKNYFKLENVNHSPWNLARILVLFHIVPTQVRLSAGL